MKTPQSQSEVNYQERRTKDSLIAKVALSFICLFCALAASFLFFDFEPFFISNRIAFFSSGLLLFPFVFALNNLAYSIFGKRFGVGVLIRCGILIFLGLTVSGFSFINSYDDHKFLDRQLIWGLITIALMVVYIAVFINFKLFGLMKGKVAGFCSYFLSCFVAECFVSFVCIPLMMYIIKLNSSEILSIAVIMFYKVFASIVISFVVNKISTSIRE
ncbi:hypothetical protein SOPP22_15300 [Shewanella sp. OPT22]|nr:hypothetical protein SOPP22_15300 [Shewanella sp. OPT22]